MRVLKKYPVVAVFFAFLAIFSLVDTVQPARERSEYENRRLQQAPAFDIASFFGNDWTREYGEYVKDQFLGRDGWITLQSTLETAQGKLEANGVWYAEDGYQIAKDEFFTANQLRLLEVNMNAVAELAARFEGPVNVMVIPSPANVLSSKLPYAPPQADEDAWLDSIFAAAREAGANALDLRETYARANTLGAQLFYYTDHHWTTTGGAWLAYEFFSQQTGQQAYAPTAPLVQVEGFYGTNYAKTKRIGTQPDVLEYYNYDNPLTIYTWQNDGTLAAETTRIMAYDQLNEYDKYAAFLHGNNGYSVIEGNGQGSILVLKDSYGNSFAPYLIENYAQIGIVDLRSWATPVDDLVTEYGYEEILVLYCFESFSTDTSAYRMGTASQG